MDEKLSALIKSNKHSFSHPWAQVQAQKRDGGKGELSDNNMRLKYHIKNRLRTGSV